MDLEKLNQEQKQAVIYDKKGPLLIVAGAGTGKTTVITQRIVHLIKNKGISPNEILALTFTNKAAQEMEQRVEDNLPFGYYDLWISTFHSFCETILRDNALEVGISPDFKLNNQTDLWLLMRQNIDKFSLNYYRPKGNPFKFIHAFIHHFLRCKDEGIYPEQYLKYSDDLKTNLTNLSETSEVERIKEVAQFYSFYQELLIANNVLDFGDVIMYCLQLFQKRPLILKKYQDQFKYILVDEFQDTNWAQYEIIKLLFTPAHNLTVCADDDQSIYCFRGACFNNIIQFRQDFSNVKEIVLKKNYRSSQDILDLAYNFIQLNNPYRLEYELNQVKEIFQDAKKKGIKLEKFKKVSKKLKATTQDRATIKHLLFFNMQQEADGVAKKILEIIFQDKDAILSDFVILVRANAQAFIFSRALEKFKIPYQFLASKGLYFKPVILDIISYLKLLNNHYESSALYRLLNLPFLKIISEDIAKITHYSYKKGISIYEALEQINFISGLSSSTLLEIDKLIFLIKEHTKLVKKESISQVLLDFIEKSGYLKYLSNLEEASARQNLNFVRQFYYKIRDFEQLNYDSNLVMFMEQLQMEIDSGEQGSLENIDIEDDPEAVKIMTIHSAKGLEFKYVFIVQLVDRRFPAINKRDLIELSQDLVKRVISKGDAHLQEERRLFYVAITRAKKGIFFTSAQNYETSQKKKTSRFLKEIDIERLEIGNDELSFDDEVKDALILKNNKQSLLSDNKKIAKAKISLPIFLSFSQLSTYEECPLQYKFAYIYRIPVKGKHYFSFGKAMHNTLFYFVKMSIEDRDRKQQNLLGVNQFCRPDNDISKQTDFKKLLDIYDQNWISEWYLNKKQEQEYYQVGKKSLKIFYENFIKTRPEIQSINSKLALEQEFKIKIGQYFLRGVIDRIDNIKDQEVEIIDYKTGKAKNVQTISKMDKQQLLIYQIAAEQAFKLEPKKLTFYYLEENKTISFLGNSQEKKAIEQEIIDQIEEIKKNNFIPKPGWQCERCDYKDICDYRAK